MGAGCITAMGAGRITMHGRITMRPFNVATLL
jgi:hypothetical protein